MVLTFNRCTNLKKHVSWLQETIKSVQYGNAYLLNNSYYYIICKINIIPFLACLPAYSNNCRVSSQIFQKNVGMWEWP